MRFRNLPAERSPASTPPVFGFGAGPDVSNESSDPERIDDRHRGQIARAVRVSGEGGVRSASASVWWWPAFGRCRAAGSFGAGVEVELLPRPAEVSLEVGGERAVAVERRRRRLVPGDRVEPLLRQPSVPWEQPMPVWEQGGATLQKRPRTTTDDGGRSPCSEGSRRESEARGRSANQGVELGGIEPPSISLRTDPLRPFPTSSLTLAHRRVGWPEGHARAFPGVSGLSHRQRSFTPSSATSGAGL